MVASDPGARRTRRRRKDGQRRIATRKRRPPGLRCRDGASPDGVSHVRNHEREDQNPPQHRSMIRLPTVRVTSTGLCSRHDDPQNYVHYQATGPNPTTELCSRVESRGDHHGAVVISRSSVAVGRASAKAGIATPRLLFGRGAVSKFNADPREPAAKAADVSLKLPVQGDRIVLPA